jgi:hypothetical protein
MSQYTYYNIVCVYIYVFFWQNGFKLRVLHQLSRQSVTWATYPTFFVLVTFLNRAYIHLGWPESWSIYLLLQHNSDYRHVPSSPLYQIVSEEHHGLSISSS